MKCFKSSVRTDGCAEKRARRKKGVTSANPVYRCEELEEYDEIADNCYDELYDDETEECDQDTKSQDQDASDQAIKFQDQDQDTKPQEQELAP